MPFFRTPNALTALPRVRDVELDLLFIWAFDTVAHSLANHNRPFDAEHTIKAGVYALLIAALGRLANAIYADETPAPAAGQDDSAPTSAIKNQT